MCLSHNIFIIDASSDLGCIMSYISPPASVTSQQYWPLTPDNGGHLRWLLLQSGW